MTREPLTPFKVRMPEALRRRIKALARANYTTVTAQIVEAVRAHCERKEALRSQDGSRPTKPQKTGENHDLLHPHDH